MKILYTESFINRLEKQIQYISQDNPSAARKFKTSLAQKIKTIPKNPHQYRKSVYFNDETIRDLIFKGYTIVFRINTPLNQIEVFGFVKFHEGP